MGKNVCLASSDKGLILKIYRALVEIYKELSTNSTKTWGRRLNRNFLKKDI